VKRPATLPAFSQEEYKKAHRLLATTVTFMMGRKFEEGDWANVYCTAKSIPNAGWSNLNIDIMYQGLGVEHKMLKVKSNKTITEYCGTPRMHPSATRSIRINSIDVDPDKVMVNVLQQYADLIEERREKVREDYPAREPDMRTGWLLWQDSLKEFLYFEEEMHPPNPNDYFAKWNESKGGGTRKPSKNLWIFEKETGIKRFSVTTSAGVKIQPYFDVPPPTDPNLYLFVVQGEITDAGMIRIWVAATTREKLVRLVDPTNPQELSNFVLETAEQVEKVGGVEATKTRNAVPLLLFAEAYEKLKSKFPGTNDDHMIQLLVEFFINQ